MIHIYLNGESIALSAESSLAEVLAERGGVQEHCAIAVNRCFIPRPQYANTVVYDGDVIDMIAPMQGG